MNPITILSLVIRMSASADHYCIAMASGTIGTIATYDHSVGDIQPASQLVNFSLFAFPFRVVEMGSVNKMLATTLPLCLAPQ